MQSQADPEVYDVAIVGGAIAGAATALLLLRQSPDLRVLIVEKRDAFDAKVGEATTEMSAMFLTRRLGLWQHLEREHLPKEGLRYWSANDRVTGHATASETGPFYRSLVPSFQLRRDVLDEHILKLAVEAGATLVRPARVKDFDVRPFDTRLTISQTHTPTTETDAASGPTDRTVRCRWLVDASGRACVLGKHLKCIDWNDEHPIASIWARWDNVRHIDDIAALDQTSLAAGNIGSRRLATNHYIGHGYWVWVIPLGNGQTSIGIVFDKRIHRLHEARDRLTTYTNFLRSNPALAELLVDATPDVNDLRALSRVAYLTRQYMGDGWAMVGDAAAFIDPYYSPGLDHMSFSVDATVELILSQLKGESPDAFPMKRDAHNARFDRSYRRFFDCVYKDKYELMGEHDLISASFLIDTALYYIFLVVPAYRLAKRFVNEPVLGPKAAYPSYQLLRFMKRRMRKIADLRRRAGEAGLRNGGKRIKAFFNLGMAPTQMAWRGAKLWIRAEVDAVRLRFKLFRGRGVRQNAEPMQPVRPAEPALQA